MENFLSYLRSIHYISPGLVACLAAVSKPKKLLKKEYLLKAGHTCRIICFVNRGLLRSYYLNKETEVSSSFVKEGDMIIAVESFFLQKPSHENIQALEESELFYIDHSDLQTIYREFPEFNLISRKLTEKYYVLSEQRLFALRMKRSHERYAFMMERFPELIQRVPSKYLASYLGVTDVTLSNIKSKI